MCTFWEDPLIVCNINQDRCTSEWRCKVAFSLPHFFPLCALHSCCQETAVALIFLSLVRYAETPANPQTSFSFLSPFLALFLHSPTLWPEITSWPACHLSSLSKRKGQRSVCYLSFKLDVYRKWQCRCTQPALLLFFSTESLRGLPLLTTNDASPV